MSGVVSVSSVSPPPVAVRVEVLPVRSKRELNEFIHLPFRLYKGNKNWVAPLLFIERQRFNVKHNPFYAHADVQLYIARREGRTVGRISAQVDSEHIRYWHERAGMFGFFECEDDPEAARVLLGAAEEFLRERGMETARGPLSFSTNGEVGLLLDAYNLPQMPIMPYTMPYYPQLVEGAGFAKAKDVFAWRWQRQPVPDGPPRKMVEELRARPDVKVRRARMDDFDAEYQIILQLYNDAWSENWGFVPATKAEADDIARSLKLIVDPAIIPIIEVDGVPAAMALALPDYNWAQAPLHGKLFPFGWLRLLWRLKVRRPRQGRLALLGVGKDFRQRQYAGLAYLICDEIYRAAKERNYEWAEFGWTLEDNGLINAIIKKVGAEHYKTYRVYEKAL